MGTDQKRGDRMYEKGERDGKSGAPRNSPHYTGVGEFFFPNPKEHEEDNDNYNRGYNSGRNKS